MNVATTNSERDGKARAALLEKYSSKEKRGPELPEKPISAARLWLVLAKAHRAMAEFVENSIADQHLCLSDFMVMEVLLHKGPLRMWEISEKVLLRGTAMTYAIDRLQTRGFVTRKYSSVDRRVQIVELTWGGEELIRQIYARHEAQLEELMADISEADLKRLHDGLKALGKTASQRVSESAS